MRISVQLRFPDEGRRWVKSIYLDTQAREVLVRTAEMTAADTPGRAMPSPASARSLLFVMDLVNARPGDEGEFQINDVRVVR